MNLCIYFMLLFLNQTLALPLSIKPMIKQSEPDIIDIGEEKSITEVNGNSGDDIKPKDVHRSTVNLPGKIWTLPVTFVFHNNLELNAKGVILRAFEQFRLKSCVDFKPRENEHYYISVEKIHGCHSFVGRYFPGQMISIGSHCDTKATVEHEFLHSLGFNHEHSRVDRDEHVTIQFDNVLKGAERYFDIETEYSTTHGRPYDYMSLMHGEPDDLTNGNGLTIITKNPAFQDIIGQRIEMSPSDVEELNLLYKCSSTVSFLMHCSFSNESSCGMSLCSQGGAGWVNVTKAPGGPSTDRTNLMSNSKMQDNVPSSFMHASTITGQEGDSACLETKRMSPGRPCPVQCLEFYYFNSGNESDQLNIWIREFQDENDFTGLSRPMGQVSGQRTSHWKYHHVSLDAVKGFQVEFEVRKGAGSSSGGFSIDDINLSEMECPHVAIQIDDFEQVLESSEYQTITYSPTQYTNDGYAYRVATILYRSYFGMLIQLVEGKNDEKLQWPLLNRQFIYQAVDQNPNIQLQMSHMRTLTSNTSQNASDGLTSVWDNPRTLGNKGVDENGREIYVGPLIGSKKVLTLEKFKKRDCIKGGSALFVFNFQDITPLINGSSLPCTPPPRVTVPTIAATRGPHSGIASSTPAVSTTHPEMTTEDDSVFGNAPGLLSSVLLTICSALLLLFQ